jgi:predicted nucleic acid-binding protein
MILIVADTGPVNYLIEIGCIEVLSRLAERTVLPTAVRDELLHPAAPDAVRAWVAAPPCWVEIRAAAKPVEAPGVSRADREAIALAEELGALLLMDDQQARRCAARIGIHTIGTVGLLEAAARRNLVRLPEVLGKLRATTCFLPDEIIEAALKRDGQRGM